MIRAVACCGSVSYVDAVASRAGVVRKAWRSVSVDTAIGKSNATNTLNGGLKS
jgi:hypothetical protein